MTPHAAVLNGFIAPPLLVVILLIAGNRQVMGARQRAGAERPGLGDNRPDVRRRRRPGPDGDGREVTA